MAIPALTILAVLILIAVARDCWLVTKQWRRHNHGAQARQARVVEDFHWDRCRQAEYQHALELRARRLGGAVAEALVSEAFAS